MKGGPQYMNPGSGRGRAEEGMKAVPDTHSSVSVLPRRLQLGVLGNFSYLGPVSLDLGQIENPVFLRALQPPKEALVKINLGSSPN